LVIDCAQTLSIRVSAAITINAKTQQKDRKFLHDLPPSEH
jgi:hypothetical protein